MLVYIKSGIVYMKFQYLVNKSKFPVFVFDFWDFGLLVALARYSNTRLFIFFWTSEIKDKHYKPVADEEERLGSAEHLLLDPLSAIQKTLKVVLLAVSRPFFFTHSRHNAQTHTHTHTRST